MWKKALMTLLSLSLLIELIFTVSAFAAPLWLLAQFKIAPTADTLFLGYVMAWFLLLVSFVCWLSLDWVKKDIKQGWTLTYILAIWWIGIGVGIFVWFGRPDNLFLDSLKGVLICVAAYKSQNKKRALPGS